MDSSFGSQSLPSAPDVDAKPFESSLEHLAATVQALAQAHQEDCLSLLALLRLLESLHREIRDGFFQQALPSNRQHLYRLLRSIETEGGWPYIHRMKLQALLEYLTASESLVEGTDSPNVRASAGISQVSPPGNFNRLPKPENDFC